jgi:hypothetical protein
MGVAADQYWQIAVSQGDGDIRGVLHRVLADVAGSTLRAVLIDKRCAALSGACANLQKGADR